MKVFFHTQRSPAIAHLQRLAECVGIACESADVANTGLHGSVMEEITPQEKPAIALDAASIGKHCSQNQLTELATCMDRLDATVLVLVSELSESTDRCLQALTENAVRGVVPGGRASRVSFPRNSAAFSKELASYSYAREPVESLGLNLASVGQSEVIMELDQSPAFVSVKVGKASFFIWATDAVFDVSRPLAAETEFELTADKYIPAIIFLRFALGDQCWRNPNPGAGIVIDDPLLKKNYGFINFSRLLESARKCGYHVTLAFIPWNHSRSRAMQTRMFLDHSDCFSICAHGCDHTKKEFGSTDYEDLLSRNFVARQRMELHRERTQMVCEPLMVCPQELYSLEAMRAFADSRQFIGVVCTACMPRNLSAPSMCGADLLLPAQDSFFGFPVFKRHYWTDISIFAMALFLGKPAILVEHHEFFRDGTYGTEAFASALLKLRPDMKWMSLAETVSRTYQRRKMAEGRYEVRFFTDAFKLEHDGEKAAQYRLVRRIPATTIVQRVSVNGVEIPFIRESGLIAFEISADQPQILAIQIEVIPIRPTKAYAPGLKYQASVALRRGLSEFRDNVIARNDFVLRAAKLVARKMKQTSG